MSSLVVAGSVPYLLAPAIEIRVQPIITVYRDLPGTQAEPESSPLRKQFADANSRNFGQLAATATSRALTIDPNPLNIPTEPSVLTLEQAAARLNVSVKKLRRLCREQKISHRRIDYRTYRFWPQDLAEFERSTTFKRKGAFRA